MADEQNREDLIRQRAYAIWVEEGCPHGREVEHWHKAAEALDAEESVLTPLHDLGADPVPVLPPTH